MVLVTVEFTHSQGDVDLVEVRGSEVESFVELLGQAAGGYPEDGSPYFRSSGGDVGLLDSNVTLGQVAAFADGDVFPVSVQGIGGDGAFGFASFMDVLGTASLLREFVALGSGAVDGYRFREQRREARFWLETGTESEPRMQLRQMVRERATWTSFSFRHVFGMDIEQSSKLL